MLGRPLTGVNKTVGNPGLLNLAFVAYEFLGFQGLGPPRNELRDRNSSWT